MKAIGPIRRLLIANRGEVARRIMRTARMLGIESVAVYSDPDAELPFVREADWAYRLGGTSPRDSYLRIDRLLEAARVTGADAVHPGFGFLAENAEFAQAVIDAGLIWVGPHPKAISAMGTKREAKAIAERAGVPIVPGHSGEHLGDFERAARAIGFPILLKASAGGGGKGMRVVRSLEELPSAYESARREAENAFGDPTLIVERYIERPKHIEIQIIGDHYGKILHLFERDCSVQRRHQKIIEEAPAPLLGEEVRKQMIEAALRLARAISYTNAGTVEMVLAPSGEFYFLEVNTRLQVEHPVTEEILGIDIVEEQIRIAQGEPLRWTQEEIDARRRGTAIEVRICAEDPWQGFLPQSGRVVLFELDPQPVSYTHL
ncbi:MAG: ATP-grasp domain-containing protein, partial [Deltaproteobacteria bacterium]|nr:ATP-grasp domain-containing protein [Deltaproteobacteria bacterium]